MVPEALSRPLLVFFLLLLVPEALIAQPEVTGARPRAALVRLPEQVAIQAEVPLAHRVEAQKEAALRVIRGETSRGILLFEPMRGENPDSVVSMSRLDLLSDGVSEYSPPGVPDTTNLLLKLQGIGLGPRGLEASVSLVAITARRPRPASTGGRIQYREEVHTFPVTCEADGCSLGEAGPLLHDGGWMDGGCLEDYFGLTEEERRRCPGQESGVGWRLCEAEAPGASVVGGRLVPQDGELSPQRSVVIQEEDGPFSCRVRASEEGMFELRGVPPGAYRLTVAGSGSTLRQAAPISLEVAPGTFPVFSLPLYPEDRLARCLTEEWCATVLTRRTSLELVGPPERRLHLLGLRLAIASGQQDGSFGTDWAVCVEDDEEAVVALREVFPNVAPASECERRELKVESMPVTREMLQHLPSGLPARSIRVDAISLTSEVEATLNFSWYVGRLWAAGFVCRVEALDGAWVPRSCDMTWIS